LTRKVLAVFGTRPEAIKMAPVVRAIEDAAGLDVRVCLTAQHREMLDQVVRLFSLPVHHDLDLMRPNQDLADLTARVLTGVRGVIAQERPDLVLVHGDTTTTLGAALAAFYQGVPVGHVEAGLRTGDMTRPFPEEANRVLTDRLSTLFFAPTAQSAATLRAEGAPAERVYVTGNTVIDALLDVRSRVARRSVEDFASALGPDGARVVGSDRIVLITGHRRESFGEGFESICSAIASLAGRYPEVLFVYPVHLNPQVQRPVRERLSGMANVVLLPPLDYEPFVWLLDRSTMVLTDSGGLQEEAPGLGKPVLVMRDVTERPEGVLAGTVALVGTSEARIVDGVAQLLDDPARYERMSRAVNPYGDGLASGRIVSAIKEWIE
jgi:UDP-N-acetylglucosamine 2-epimerase (non-hydrolysing)